MALIFVAAGIIGASTSLTGYVFNAIRNVEEIIPDQYVTASCAVDMPKIAED